MQNDLLLHGTLLGRHGLVAEVGFVLRKVAPVELHASGYAFRPCLESGSLLPQEARMLCEDSFVGQLVPEGADSPASWFWSCDCPGNGVPWGAYPDAPGDA